MVMVKYGAMRRWLLWIVVLTTFDQATKRLAETLLSFATPVEILPSLNLMLTYNEGAAFSLLSDAGGWQRWFFIVIAVAICAYIIRWLSQLQANQVYTARALVLIVSGGLGNVIDRILFAKVTDFIDVYYISQEQCLPLFFNWSQISCHWPTFNVADILICLGTALLLTQILRENRSNGTD